MRLENVERGHRWLERLELAAMRWTSGQEPPDVVKTLLYRPAVFGRPFARLVHRSLRGPSTWSVGEREAFAAAVSEANDCPFCANSHRAVAVRALNHPLDGLAPRAAVMSAFLRKLAASPDSVHPADLAALRQAGISEAAIEDGICICSLFCVINRIANTLDFALQDEAGLARSADTLLRFGYRM